MRSSSMRSKIRTACRSSGKAASASCTPRSAGKLRYDLALREGDTVRIFYGVTEDGMEGAWSTFLGDE